MSSKYSTQNELLLHNLLSFYNDKNLEKMLSIINGESKISLRIVDWFTTNYAKKHYTVYENNDNIESSKRFKVYNDYKLKLKAYSKKRFDPFCRWERIAVPYKDKSIQTTIGQLNFFRWAIENNVLEYIENNYSDIEYDMNSRNSTAKKQDRNPDKKTRKRREELSLLASKSIKKEDVEIVIKFS